MNGRPYTRKDDKVLLSLRELGLTYKSISERVNRTTDSLRNRWQDLNGARPQSNGKPKFSGKLTTRPCLCCGRKFKSQGPHNRLCNLCRRESDV